MTAVADHLDTPKIEFVVERCREGFALIANGEEMMICDSKAEAADVAVSIAQESGALYTLYL